MKTEKIKEQVDEELYRLSKGFKALNLDHQKGVLKTAQGLLIIQRKYKEMVANNTKYVDFSLKSKNG